MNTLRAFCVFIIVSMLSGTCFANSQVGERQTFIITCASGELGSATAKLLAHDYDLILTGRNIAKLKNLQAELKTTNAGRYDICSLDFVSNTSRDSFKKYLKQSHLSISGLVLIAPRPQFNEKALLQDEKTWLEVIENTFTGPLEALKIVQPYLTNPGKIVVISGTTSVQLQPEHGPACVIRRMWTTYTKALSHQLGPQGISINALSPGVVLTNFHQEKIQAKAYENGLSYEDQMQKEVANIPLRRHAAPQEVAQTIKFLLTEQSDFINGINLLLDGGSTLSY